MDGHPGGADPATGPPAPERARARLRAWIADGLLPPDTPLPDGALAEYVDEVLGLAERLNGLPLDGVEPLLGPPRWA